MVPSLVLDGKELAVPDSSLGPNFSANHGQPVFLETLGTPFTFDGNRRFLVPHCEPIVSGSSPRYIADMFRGRTISPSYKLAGGNDAQVAQFAIDDSLKALVGTTGNAGTGIAADGIAISGPSLGWTNGTTNPMEILARLKFDAITNLRYFLGFTDVLPTTTFEQPFSLSVASYTSTASDACGILFDTAATTDTIRAVGVAADTDATHVDTGLAPVADTYMKVRISVLAGVMSVYLDDVLAATVSAAITTSVALTPILVVVPTSTASRVCTVKELFAK